MCACCVGMAVETWVWVVCVGVGGGAGAGAAVDFRKQLQNVLWGSPTANKTPRVTNVTYLSPVSFPLLRSSFFSLSHQYSSGHGSLAHLSGALCTLPSLPSPPPRDCGTSPPHLLFYVIVICILLYLWARPFVFLNSHAFLPLLRPAELDWCLWSCCSCIQLPEGARLLTRLFPGLTAGW